MNLSAPTIQQANSPVKNIPRRITGDRDGRTSAQSSLAHWDEDWTLIADMTERRRIQNRIAQRNYRRRLKERLSRLEEHASRAEKSSKKDKPSKDRNDEPRLFGSSQSQTRHKNLLPLRIATPKAATDDSTSPKDLYQDPGFVIDQQNFSASYPLSPNISSLSSQTSMSMIGYPEFSTAFENSVFDYPSTQVWHRAIWPHP